MIVGKISHYLVLKVNEVKDEISQKEVNEML